MANMEHLDMLKQGVKVWNDWRKINPNIIPSLTRADLSGADLSKADLSKANLSWNANLSETNLSEANLRRANLYEANLRRANLYGANLSEADLRRANLYGADLSGANLNKANLRRVNFRLACLIGADLRQANLDEANLLEADLGRANLYGTDLSGVDLSKADLRQANLSGANLIGTLMMFANFKGTNLTKSNFKDSVFYHVTITNCDLSNIIGLDSVRHQGPSTIDIKTIFKSKGKIPISFLRGCGIPDDVVKTMLKFAKKSALRFYSCFISYSHKDEIFAEKLKKNLKANYVSCYFFPEDAVWGKDIEENIDRAVREYDKLIVVCSENSLNSEPVLREIDRALQKEQALKEKHKKTKRILFPVIIDNYFYEKWDHHLKPLMLRIVYGDFRDWKDPTKYKKVLNKLLEGLQKD